MVEQLSAAPKLNGSLPPPSQSSAQPESGNRAVVALVPSPQTASPKPQ